MKAATLKPLRFEPHNGFGGKAPDGTPWPFGYLSEAEPTSPVFELNVIVEHPTEKLLTYARAAAASVGMLDALKAIAEGEWDEANPNALKSIVAMANAAIAKAEGRS